MFIFVYILSTQKDWIVSFYWYWIYNCPCFCLLELACFLYFVLAVGISFSSLNGICRRLDGLIVRLLQRSDSFFVCEPAIPNSLIPPHPIRKCYNCHSLILCNGIKRVLDLMSLCIANLAVTWLLLRQSGKKAQCPGNIYFVHLLGRYGTEEQTK